MSARTPLRAVCWALLAALLGGCVAQHLRTPAQSTGLDAWIDEELVPYLSEQLARHPRFRGEPLALAAMDGTRVQGEIDGLTAQVRERVEDALVSSPGLALLWARDAPGGHGGPEPARLRCGPRSGPHYYLGIDTGLAPNGDLTVKVRALDLIEGTWVSGFGLSWRGRSNASQRRALAASRPDTSLRGLRSLPFSQAEPDLAAARLARDLGCRLQESGVAQAAIHAPASENEDPFVRTTRELLARHLERLSGLRLAARPAGADLILGARAHRVDGDLHQLWADLAPAEQGSPLPGTGADVYVRLGDPPPPPPRGIRTPSAAPVSATAEPARPGAALIGPLRVVTPRDQRLCASADPWSAGAVAVSYGDSLPPGGCYALELELRREAQVFLLAQDAGAGPVRLLPGACGSIHGPGPVRSGEVLHFPAPGQGVLTGDQRGAVRSYYALAVADPGALAALAAHLQALPGRCRVTSGPPAPARWLSDLEALMQAHPGRVQWQAMRVRAEP